MRGRPPKTTEEKRRAGNPGKRPLPEPFKVEGEYAELVAPASLYGDALEFWNDIVPSLKEVGVIDGIDRHSLEHMCVLLARAKQMRRVLDEDGAFALGSMGQIVAHPAVAIEQAAVALWLRFAEQYALTPAGRARLGLAALKARSLSEELRAALEDDDDDDDALIGEAEELPDGE